MGKKSEERERSLYAAAARRLGRDTVPWRLWAYMKAKDYVKEVLDDVMEPEDFLAAMVEIHEAGRDDERRLPAAAQGQEITLSVNEAEEERLAALADYLFMAASRRDDVRDYRQKYLPDGLRPDGEGLLHWDLLQRNAVLPPAQAEELRLLIAMLTTSYPWTEIEAAAFVVEGRIPDPPVGRARLVCLDGDDYRRARLELEFDVRMDAKQIAGFVRSVQRAWLGKENHPLTKQGLALFRFAAAQWREAEGLTLAEIGRRWNGAHPDESAMSAPHFDRAFHRAEQHLANRTPRSTKKPRA